MQESRPRRETMIPWNTMSCFKVHRTHFTSNSAKKQSSEEIWLNKACVWLLSGADTASYTITSHTMIGTVFLVPLVNLRKSKWPALTTTASLCPLLPLWTGFVPQHYSDAVKEGRVYLKSAKGYNLWYQRSFRAIVLWQNIDRCLKRCQSLF